MKMGLKRAAQAVAAVVMVAMLVGCISVIGGRREGGRDNGGLTVEPGREAVVHCVEGAVAGRIEKTQGDWLILRDAGGVESWVRMSDISQIDYR